MEPDRKNVLLVSVRGARRHLNNTPPLGLLYLASWLRQTRPDVWVEIIDQKLSATTNRTIADLVAAGRYGVVGLSCFTEAAPQANTLASVIKSRSPGTVIVVGGPHPCASPEQALREPAVDFAMFGEGEVALERLLGHLMGGGGTSSLVGVAYRNNGHVVVTSPAPPIDNLDDLPFPAWDRLDPRPYWKREGASMMGRRPYLPIVSSRSCPYNCVYCHRIFGKGYRVRSPANVVEEMRLLGERYGVNEFEFIEDVFNHDESRAIEILERVRVDLPGARLQFPIGLRADRLSPRLVDSMSKAGVYYALVGVESASPRIQKLLRKGLNIDAANAGIQRLTGRGILCLGTFLFGFPSESVNEMRQTISFAVNSELHMASFHRLVPFMGTALYDSLDEEARERIAATPGDRLATTANVSAVSDDELKGIIREATRRFYLQPRRIVRVLRSHPRRLDAARTFAAGLVRARSK